MVMIRLDFNEDAFVQKNVVDRMPLIDRMAGYGGTIGKYQNICFFASFLMALSKFIALPTIAIAIVVALSRS